MDCPDAHVLAALGEGSLSASERTQVEEHIDACSVCTERVAERPRADASGSSSDALATIWSGPTASDQDSKGSKGSKGSDPLRRLGRYVLLERLGAGAMGEVHAAYDPELDRRVALKILRPNLRRGASQSVGQARLLREAQATASLSHPNVITVHDVGSVGSQVFIAMELVEGVDLRRWQEEGGRSWAEVLAVYLQAGEGLAAAHGAGLLHRDFKPDNVRLGHDGIARVLDFGLAKATGDETNREGPRELSGSLLGSGELTMAGTVLGTPAYMAPEQLRGDVLDARADLFSFCVALWEAVHGERPFHGTTFETLRAAIVTGAIAAPPASRHVPAWLDRALRRGLAPDREARPPSMRALLDVLRSGLGRRRRWLSGIGLGLGFCVVAGLAYWQGRAEHESVPAAAPCAGAPARVEGVWPAARRSAIEAAFDATGLPFARASWSSVDQSVAGYLERWQTGSWKPARPRTCSVRSPRTCSIDAWLVWIDGWASSMRCSP
ncbi:serine/threonine-protein kinase [Paraliomyxa miuraensis]|uniref:serine/threonine-protein kinase n=1 Tax=Paraliomyxa miuraensis TaxID=376150 RepID=UPI0022562C6A|nr:serine/threonine-protein kinase [Paraliomyxa miuraensis]MCX4241130.1 serine/threonine protein kinase [Paraliomyxa miuraensis]